ncbi:hypothetical protein QBC34DRAFT_297698 [Podospora aff. communis PSN243]|uniref:Uncharacterized protein n=1 Tax=Podospora aff. communis PSN243 TaxID=3040156 RepID=A0AAV9GQV9_9PEZI|nr:hypothetical protein QBC34DRAFT_297698 [Podospora aff. communis PSN243]
MSPLSLICRWPSPLRKLAAILLLLLTVAPRPYCAWQLPVKSIPGSIAFGFDLGQSYGTSVARFENGTTITLVKIPGTVEYVTLMESLVAQPITPNLLSYAGIVGRFLDMCRSILRSLGPAHAKEIRVLGEMLSALKTASGAILQTEVQAVAVTAPWVAAWDHQFPRSSVVNKALVRAGLEPFTWFSDGPIYLGETSAALASEERWLCLKNWCTGHWMEVYGEEETTGGPLFFVSGCYFYGHQGNNLALIDPRYGLDQKSLAESPAQFWSDLKSHIMSLVKEHGERVLGCEAQLPLTMLVTGEAADTPEFLDIVHGVVRETQQLCSREPKVAGCKANKTEREVDLVILDDGTYGPAKGAAFWLWTRMSSTYCAEYYAEHGIVEQSSMKKEVHKEL